jgi:hypothetical protein
MVTQRDIMVEAERRKELVARMEKDQLIRRMTRQEAPRAKTHQLWLARLGAKLETWGCHLQARYGKSLSIPSAAQQRR